MHTDNLKNVQNIIIVKQHNISKVAIIIEMFICS